MDRLRLLSPSVGDLIARWERRERRVLPRTTPRPLYLLLVIVLLAATGWNLARDISYLRTIPIDDIFAYECYARAFWHGPLAVRDAPHTHLCIHRDFRFWVAPPQAFHTLPREYPAPAVLVFSLPLLLPFAPYDVAFMALMAAFVMAIATMLALRGPFLCAVACALYVLVGGWATALARYDIIPGALALLALILAERRRFTWAYLALAAGTLLKIYPLFLIPVLAVHEWRATGRHPWRHVGLFGVVTALGFLPGALLDAPGFIQPLLYNGARPPQIESVAGSLLWLTGRLGSDAQVKLTFHSLNVTGTLGPPLSWGATLLLVGGLVVACRRAWLDVDSLGRSFVLVILVTLSGSKLLSPQYLLWLFPVVAYAEGLRLRWALLALLTVTIYPHAYGFHSSMVQLPDHPLFMGAILSRNAVLLTLTLWYLAGTRRGAGGGTVAIPQGRAW
ncbi:MAG: hypothetical protein NVSMB65_12260 [Chloroflexota bacterium]